MRTPILETHNLAIGYTDRTLASDLNISLFPGEVVAMLGENGAGKSTLIKTISGEISPKNGYVEIDGRRINEYSRKEFAKKIALVTTDPIQAGGLTVKELVALGRQPHTGFFGRLSESDNSAVDKAMTQVGILHKAHDFVANLSDGERQKALIARAIAQDTPIIILDEPFSFLDVASRVEILSLLIESAHNNNTSILFSSHDVAQALRMTDKTILFSNNNKIIMESPDELKSSGEIRNLFTNRNVHFDPIQNDFVSNNTL